MYKRFLLPAILLSLVVVSASVAGLVRPNSSNGDPCDEYGNCIFSSLSFGALKPRRLALPRRRVRGVTFRLSGSEHDVILALLVIRRRGIVRCGRRGVSGGCERLRHVFGDRDRLLHRGRDRGQLDRHPLLLPLHKPIGRDARFRPGLSYGDEQRDKLTAPSPPQSRRFVLP